MTFFSDSRQVRRAASRFPGLSIQDPTHFTVKVNVGISYIKGTAEVVKMELAEADRPETRAVQGGKGKHGRRQCCADRGL